MRRIVLTVCLGLVGFVAADALAAPYQSPDSPDPDIALAPARFQAIKGPWYLLEYNGDGTLKMPHLLVPSSDGYKGHYPTNVEDGDGDGHTDTLINFDTDGNDATDLDVYAVGTFWDYLHEETAITYATPGAVAPGHWRIGLDVRNFVWDSSYQVPSNYKFEIAYLDASGTPREFEGELEIPAEDTETTNGWFTLDLDAATTLTVTYQWQNDESDGSYKWDANLRIDRAFFDRIDAQSPVVPVPEPGSALLFAAGLGLLARGCRRRR